MILNVLRRNKIIKIKFHACSSSNILYKKRTNFSSIRLIPIFCNSLSLQLRRKKNGISNLNSQSTAVPSMHVTFSHTTTARSQYNRRPVFVYITLFEGPTYLLGAPLYLFAASVPCCFFYRLLFELCGGDTRQGTAAAAAAERFVLVTHVLTFTATHNIYK